VGVDVGGTFTDVMYWDDQNKTLSFTKFPPLSRPRRGMMSGLRELSRSVGISISDVDQLFHGTTVATNTVLERKGSDVGMLTTKGFRDIIYIGRHRRPYTFSIYQDIPWREPTLARAAYRIPIAERIVAPSGDVLRALDEDESGLRSAS